MVNCVFEEGIIIENSGFTNDFITSLENKYPYYQPNIHLRKNSIKKPLYLDVGEIEKYFDKYAGDLLLKYSDVSFNLTSNTPLKEYYKIIEYPKNKKVINFLRASVINSRIQTSNLLNINYQLLQEVKETLEKHC